MTPADNKRRVLQARHKGYIEHHQLLRQKRHSQTFSLSICLIMGYVVVSLKKLKVVTLGLVVGSRK